MFRSARRAPRANPFNTRPAQGAVSAPHRFLGACVIPGRRTEVRLVDLHGVNETRRRVPQGVHRYSPDGTIWEPNTLCVREAAADGLLCDCVFFACLIEGHPVEFEGYLYRLCANAPRDFDNLDDLPTVSARIASLAAASRWRCRRGGRGSTRSTSSRIATATLVRLVNLATWHPRSRCSRCSKAHTRCQWLNRLCASYLRRSREDGALAVRAMA